MKKILSVLIGIIFALQYTGLSCTAKTVTVKSGTVVPVVFESVYNSKNTVSGAKIQGKIANDVFINNILVFKKGDSCELNIANAKKAGFVGNPGEIMLSNGTVNDINGEEHIALYSQVITGDEKTYPKVLLGVSIFLLFPLALFAFVKGGQAEIKPFVPIELRLSQNFDFTPEAN